MNKLSGYFEYRLRSGRTVEFKFCNGAEELYGELVGLQSLKAIEDSLSVPTRPFLKENGEQETDLAGKPLFVQEYTIDFLISLRLWLYAAAKYVCLVQNKPVDFNEYSIVEWLEEIDIKDIVRATERTPAAIVEAKAESEEDSDDEEETGTMTLGERKWIALKALNITPEVYYDLTAVETAAMLDGVNERRIDNHRLNRRLATLIHNAHFKDPKSEFDLIPLPGDKAIQAEAEAKKRANSAREAFWMFASQFGDGTNFTVETISGQRDSTQDSTPESASDLALAAAFASTMGVNTADIQVEAIENQSTSNG